MFQIRVEEPSDSAAIRELTVEAFRQTEFGHNGEADLIDAIRVAHNSAISLVAVHEGMVIGHLLSSPALLETNEEVINGMAIGPISVLPDWQRKRVGSALIGELLVIAKKRGNAFVAVAGHPTYYPRFGFRVLSDVGVRHCFNGMPDEYFFIQFLVPIDSSKTEGVLRYCAEFGVQDR